MGGANQGGETYRILKGFWGKEHLVELKVATVHKNQDQKYRAQDMINDVVEELAKIELNQWGKRG